MHRLPSIQGRGDGLRCDVCQQGETLTRPAAMAVAPGLGQDNVDITNMDIDEAIGHPADKVFWNPVRYGLVSGRCSNPHDEYQAPSGDCNTLTLQKHLKSSL